MGRQHQMSATVTGVVMALGLGLGLGASDLAFAQDIQLRLINVRGMGNGSKCSMDSVHTLFAGESGSVLFDKFGVDLPAGAAPRQNYAVSVCEVNLGFVLPRGTYLKSANAQVTAGAIKDRGAAGYMDASYHLLRQANSLAPALSGLGPLGRILHMSRVFYTRDAVHEPLFDMTDMKVFGRHHVQQMCQWTRSRPVSLALQTRLTVAATRQNARQSAILQVDSSDTQLTLGMMTGQCI